MNVKDTLQNQKGHWELEVIEGEPERLPLTPEQIRENQIFKEKNPDVPYPLHAGFVVNKRIDRYEGDNLVVTTGKSLLLNRLFAMGGPPAALSAIGVGATAAAAVVGDTQLGSTPTIKVYDALPTIAGLVVTCITTFLTTEANISWNELAMFNGTVNGTSIMFNRIAPIGPFAKTSAVSIIATVTVTQS